MKGSPVKFRMAILVAALALSTTVTAHADPTTVTATATATAVATPTTTTVTAPPTTVTVTVTAAAGTTTTPPPASPILPAGSEYVAMGDSYSSGEGANQNPGGTQDPTLITGNCRRSTKAAQVLMTAQFGWTLINPACGGSTTANVLNAFGWEQPQMNLVTANTKLTTMTIGGNDVQLLQLIVNCIMTTVYGDCIASNPSAAQVITPVDNAINTLEPKIENVVRAIVTKAPQARIRMAGYPWIVPPPGQPVGTCTALSSGEQAMFDQRLTAVNFAIRQGTLAVAAANPTRDIQYLDPMAAGSPFAVTDNGCSTTSTRYMNAATGDATNWHPNINGQADYATLYKSAP